MIIRIFIAKVYPHLKDEFAENFERISVPITRQAEGLIDLEIGESLNDQSDEFVMISKWKNEHFIKKFAGVDWSKAFVPTGMDKYLKDCSVHHFKSMKD